MTIKNTLMSVVAASAAFGGMAMAQSASAAPKLTEEQEFALSIVRDFNTCYAKAQADPARQQMVQARNAWVSEARKRMTPEETAALINAKKALTEAEKSGGDIGDIVALEEALTALNQQIIDRLVPLIGPLPVVTPSDSDIGQVCLSEQDEKVWERGMTQDDVEDIIFNVKKIIGAQEFERRTAPVVSAPAP